MKIKEIRRLGLFFCCTLFHSSTSFSYFIPVFPWQSPPSTEATSSNNAIFKELSLLDLQESLKKAEQDLTYQKLFHSKSPLHSFPHEIKLTSENGESAFQVNYTFNSKLQSEMETVISRFHPDYAALVAIDVKSGEILTMVSYANLHFINSKPNLNLAVQSGFPAASIFKVVTAAAAIEMHHMNADTIIPYSGRSHTLYRHQIQEDRLGAFTRITTLKQAFALSINTVFGKIGAFTLSAPELNEYAQRFGFNQKIWSDIEIEKSASIIQEDWWSIAESASGFTRNNTMSPIHGAMIAATIANQGIVQTPYLIRSLQKIPSDPKTFGPYPIVYQGKSPQTRQVIDSKTADEIQKLMIATVQEGTSRSVFKGFAKKQAKLGREPFEVGGKTGSLSGLSPKGKYDWFIGYLKTSHRSVAVAALTISEKLWKVKSSTLVREFFERFF